MFPKPGGSTMHRLFTGTGIALALMIAGPTWAQSPTTSPAAGQPSMPSAAQPSMPSAAQPSMPAPAPYARQTPATPQAQPYAQAPAQPTAPYAQPAPMQPPAASTGATTAAEPADTGRGMSRQRHAARGQHARNHGKHMTTASRRGGRSNDNVADQLNREEASRLASGSSMAPSQTPPAAAPTQGTTMPGGSMSGAPMSNAPSSAGQMR